MHVPKTTQYLNYTYTTLQKKKKNFADYAFDFSVTLKQGKRNQI